MQAITDAELQNWHNYEVTSRREIHALLRQIGEKNQLVRMLVQGEGDVCVTSILDLDDDDDTLIVDCSINREQNARIVQARRLRFETTLDKIRIVFAVDGLEAVTYDGRPALRGQIPPTLIRLQRREYYRMETPVTHPVRVIVPAVFEAGSAVQGFPLADISCGGVALLDPQLLLNNTIGHMLVGCRLDLPDGPVTSTLAVRNSIDLTLLNGKTSRRLGCEFVDLSRGNLANVQRYITKLERERNARLAGLS